MNSVLLNQIAQYMTAFSKLTMTWWFIYTWHTYHLKAVFVNSLDGFTEVECLIF